jgi:hypothetical protein
MFSDVLSNAVADMEKYQREMPDAYAALTSEISVVKTAMDSLRMILDAAPRQSAEFEKLVEELRASLRAVDVSPGLHAGDTRRQGAKAPEGAGRLQEGRDGL